MDFVYEMIFCLAVYWAFIKPAMKAVETYNASNEPKLEAPMKISDVPSPVVLYRQDPFKWSKK